jgi:glucose-1-phosphate thymidylyltransferase
MQSADLIGLIPAAGIAARIAPLPCSKELFPIGYQAGVEQGGLRPKPVCLYLLECMRAAGVRRTFIVLRTGKWDIPTYLGSGSIVGMNIAYLIMQKPFGAPYTIDEAYPYIDQANVAFGFPDILFNGEGVYDRLHKQLLSGQADVVLGLFRIQEGQRADMVEVDSDGRVQRILIKPGRTNLEYAWITAVWRPTFTKFMHNFLALQLEQETSGQELYVGDVFQAAIEKHMTIESVSFSDRLFYDIGTPNGLLKAITTFGDANFRSED